MLNIDYQPDTDAQNRLRPGVPLRMGIRLVSANNTVEPLRVERGDLRFWVSTDHGKQWHEADVMTERDDTFRVMANGVKPRSGDVVSVRARGETAAGLIIDQTIVDAYPVR